MKYKNEVVNLNPGKKKFVKFLIFDFFCLSVACHQPFHGHGEFERVQ